MSNTDELLTAIERVIGEIGDEDNQFGTASAGWVWWQEHAEELAALVGGLDLAIRRGGPLPAAWAPDPLAGAYYCPDCGAALDDWRGHGSECIYREKDSDEEDPGQVLAELAAADRGPSPELAAALGWRAPDPAADDDACPADPDGLHHAGCGCDGVDPLNPNEERT